MIQAQNDLDILSEWLKFNLLTINTTKTCYVIFHQKNKKVPSHNPLVVNNSIIIQKSHEKYLGLWLDSHLMWTYQINHISKKLSSLLGSLRSVSQCVPIKLRYNIYNSLVKSYLSYLIEIWGNASKTKLHELQIKQNKLVKMLFHYHHLTPTKTIYTKLGIMNIKQLYTYNTCILIKKIINRNIHTNLSFIKNSQIYNRSTRRGSLLVIPKVRTKFAQKNITFDGALLYNKLPYDIRNVSSHNVFKSKLCKYILTNYSEYL